MLDQLQEETQHLRYKLAHPGEIAAQLRRWLAETDVRLGFSLIGGTAVWALYFSSVHALNSLACRWGWFGVAGEGSTLKPVQLAVAAAALALVAAAGYNAWSIWRGTRRQAHAGEAASLAQPGALEEPVAARSPFQAFVILLLNVLYLLIILLTLAPITLLAPCSA